jgi:hypothetical protein
VVEVRWVAAPLTFYAMHLGDVVASLLDRRRGAALEIMLNDRYVESTWPSGIGRLLDSNLVADAWRRAAW